MIPIHGTLERVFFDALLAAPKGRGVTFLDLVGTGITEENIEQLAENLRNGMYESEGDSSLIHDA
jgi:hypothetical protein